MYEWVRLSYNCSSWPVLQINQYSWSQYQQGMILSAILFPPFWPILKKVIFLLTPMYTRLVNISSIICSILPRSFKTDINPVANVNKACQYQQYYMLYPVPFFKTAITHETNVKNACQYHQYYLPYPAPFFKTDITLDINVNKNRKTYSMTLPRAPWYFDETVMFSNTLQPWLFEK